MKAITEVDNKENKDIFGTIFLIANIIVAAFIISFLLEIFLWTITPSFGLSEEMNMFLIFTFPTFIGFILFPILFLIRYKRMTLTKIGFTNRFNGLAMITLIISCSAIIYILYNYFSIAWNSFIHFTVIGFGEELLFRGIMLVELCKIMKPVLALFISSFVFAVVFHSGESFIDNITIRLFLGVTLGVIFLYTKNLWAVGFLHVAYNLFISFSI